MIWILCLIQAFFFLITYYSGRYWVLNPPWNHPRIFRNKFFIITLGVIVPLMTILLPIYAFMANISPWWFLLFSLLGWSYVSYKVRMGGIKDAYSREIMQQYSLYQQSHFSETFDLEKFMADDEFVLTDRAKEQMRSDLEKEFGVSIPHNDR